MAGKTIWQSASTQITEKDLNRKPQIKSSPNFVFDSDILALEPRHPLFEKVFYAERATER